MDINYNILKIEELLNRIFLKSIEKGENVKLLIRDLMNEKEPDHLEENDKLELEKYAKESIHLVLERKILLSLENHSLNQKLSYWESLKDRGPKTRTYLLTHFYDAYLEDLKTDSFHYHDFKTIHEIEKEYETRITESLEVFASDMQRMIENASSITLNHMKNINANGRTVSVQDKENHTFKKGGIFLTKQSKIGYAKFINKTNLIDSIYMNGKEIELKVGIISVYGFEKIVQSLNQTLKVEKNKNVQTSDTRIIHEGNKKVGSIFLGKSGIDLEDGTYISVEELSQALNQYLKHQNDKVEEKPKKVIKKTGRLQKFAAMATLVSIVVTVANNIFNNQKLTFQVEAAVEAASNHSLNVNSVSLKENGTSNLQTFSQVMAQPNEQNKEETLKEEEQKEIIQEVMVSDLDNETVEVIQDKELSKETSQEEASKEETEELSEEASEEKSKLENQTLEANLETEIVHNLESANNNVLTELQANATEDIVKQPNDVWNQKNIGEEEKKDTDSDQLAELDTLKEVQEEKVVTEEIFAEEVTKNDVQEEVSMDKQVAEEGMQEETTGDDIVNYALNFVGNEYEYGGTSLTEGVDCSGFTQAVYGHFGIELPRTSDTQRELGTTIGVDLENALPGDLIFYDGHVAIYIGNGEIVHAATEKSGIKISPADYGQILSIQRIIGKEKMEEEGKTK